MDFSTLTLMQVRDMLISGKVTSAALVEEYTKIVTDDNKSKEPLKGFIELYGDAAEKAAACDAEIAEARKNGAEAVKALFEKKPLLGICLGMQMLFDKSFEFGETDGLGLIPGTVKLMTPPGLLIPQIGWNRLIYNEPCALLEGLGDEPYVYFVHSYAADCGSGNVAAYTDYGDNVPACVFAGNVYGCQFHPEKSGETGLTILRNFLKL